MSDFQVHISRPVLAAALRDVAGAEFDVSAPNWEVATGQYVQELMSNPEQAARLIQWLEDHNQLQEDSVRWPENPGLLRRASVTGPDDGLFENLPTGAADEDMFGIQGSASEPLQHVVSAVDDFADQTRECAKSWPYWAAPSVLGFPDVWVEFPKQPQRLNRVLEETRRRLERRILEHKTSLTERLRSFWQAQPPTDWVVASDHLAPNCTVVETTHGPESMVLKSVVYGSYLYVVVTSGEVSARNRLSLDDEEASIRKLEEVLADHGEAAQKALGNLRFLLEDPL